MVQQRRQTLDETVTLALQKCDNGGEHRTKPTPSLAKVRQRWQTPNETDTLALQWCDNRGKRWMKAPPRLQWCGNGGERWVSGNARKHSQLLFPAVGLISGCFTSKKRPASCKRKPVFFIPEQRPTITFLSQTNADRPVCRRFFYANGYFTTCARSSFPRTSTNTSLPGADNSVGT